MAACYGGDDIGAIVLDVGTAWTKAGYAGEDSPEVFFATQVGRNTVEPEPEQDDVDVDPPKTAAEVASNARKTYIGDLECSVWRKNMEITNPVQHGQVADWDGLEQIWTEALKTRMMLQPSEHPLLVVESAWNPREARRQMAELAFETFNVPGFFLSKSPALAGFAAAKSTALVVECGAGACCVSVLFDGYVLSKSVVTSKIAGNALSEITRQLYGNHCGMPFHPSYTVQSKKRVSPGTPCSFKASNATDATPSFHFAAEMRSMNDLKESCFAVRDVNSKNGGILKQWEHPCGYTSTINDPYYVPEALFNPAPYAEMIPAYLETQNSESQTSARSIIEMILTSIAHVDKDAKPVLLSNIVLTGASVNFPGFADRLTRELLAIMPSLKIRTHAPSNQSEKTYGAWLGGSILASLGTFHQLWVSKHEYQEVGRQIIEKKCI